MSRNAVEFESVWKKFRRGERYDSLRDLIPSLVGRVRGRGKRERPGDFWAVQDVSFAVPPGAALGIIGNNGAGKSTSLKLLSKLMKPTRGHCQVRGRMGCLIEIAAGFHPDLTGRENIFLQGAIMGMKRREIAGRLDRIVEFAGVDDFIDTPVKRYSTGMNARLGFAIAAHLEPDVLLIDEVLGVGDVAFQLRCVERMKQFKRDGVAIVFVSHNLQAIDRLCDQTVLLRQGRAVRIGPTADVLSEYVQGMSSSAGATDDGAEAAIGQARLTDEAGRPAASVRPGQRLRLTATFTSGVDVGDLTLGFYLYRSTDRLMVYDGNIHGGEIGLKALRAGEPVEIDFGFDVNLTRGQYHLGLHLFHNPTQAFLARLEPAGLLSVEETRSNQGVADLRLTADRVRPTLGQISRLGA